MCLFSDLKSGKCSSVVEARLLQLWEAGNVKRGGDLMWVDMFNNGIMDRLQILKPQETNCKLNSQNFSGTRKDNQEENPDQASEMAKIGRSSHVTDLMDRFQTLKRREAEQVHKSLNSLDVNTDSGDDQPGNKTQICDHLWPDSMMTLGRDSQIEMHVGTEPSAYLDWEHVPKDD